jgi:hypothetical protein
LPRFLLKRFEIPEKPGLIWRLDIGKKKIGPPIPWSSANTSPDYYSAGNEARFCKLELLFSRLCKMATVINNNPESDDVIINQIKAKEFIKDWVLADAGRMRFNMNTKTTDDEEYNYRERNAVISDVCKCELPKSASDFIDNSCVVLLRNSTSVDFVLGSCHRIEGGLEGCATVIFPISPKLALCFVDKKWIRNKAVDLKENEIVIWNYDNQDHILGINKYVLEGVQRADLNEIYSCSKNELERLLDNLV